MSSESIMTTIMMDDQKRSAFMDLLNRLAGDGLTPSDSCGECVGYNKDTNNLYIILDVEYDITMYTEVGSGEVKFLYWDAETKETGNEFSFETYEEAEEYAVELKEKKEEEDDGFVLDCDCGYIHHYEDKCPAGDKCAHYEKNKT